MHVVVAGCGRVGSQLAQFLSYEGHDVVIIDSDAASFGRLGSTFNGITLEGVAFDEDLLHEAGIEKADAYAAVTNYDNTNLMAAEVARDIYKVPTVISRLYEIEKELTFFKMGIDYICSTTLMAERFREKLFQADDLIVQQERPDLGIQVVEFGVDAESEGKPAGSLNYGVSSRLVSLLRENRVTPWSESTPLRAGDRVVVTLRKEGWNTVKECLGLAPPSPGATCPVARPSLPPGISAVVEDERPEGARVVIAGCSAVGSHLGYLLSVEGHRVTILDKNPALFKRLPEAYDGDFVEGTVFDPEALAKAGIESAHAFASLTKFDNTNLMAAEVARHVFHVPHVMARLFNPDKEETYRALGMNYVCGTRLLAQSILQRILMPEVVPRTSLFNNLYDLVEFLCPEPWENRSVGWAMNKTGISFAYLVRRNTGYMPDANFMLRAGDTVAALGTTGKLQRLEKQLKKLKKG